MQTAIPWYFSDPSYAKLFFNTCFDDEKTMPSSFALLNQRAQDRKPENRITHVADGGLVKAKTLVIWGDGDATCSLASGKAVADAIPGANLVVIEGTGHMTWFEAPDRFWSAVDQFLKE